MMRSSRTTCAALAAGFVLGACASNPQTSQSPQPTSGASSPRTSSATVPAGGTPKTMAELFRGKFPGVEVFEAPGGGIRVKIRNSGALNGDLSSRNSDVGDPIYVVDNVEVSAPDGVLFMDPNSIARIEVERVSALYGIRGSNGVIKITTKH
jgi:outer membrane receptor protein involved in Fe transport